MGLETYSNLKQKKAMMLLLYVKLKPIIQKRNKLQHIFLYLFCENPSTAERETHDGQTNTFRSNKLIFSGVPYTTILYIYSWTSGIHGHLGSRFFFKILNQQRYK